MSANQAKSSLQKAAAALDRIIRRPNPGKELKDAKADSLYRSFISKVMEMKREVNGLMSKL